jgi:hypothetical protein
MVNKSLAIIIVLLCIASSIHTHAHNSSIDISSLSNIDQIKQDKIAFDFHINFDKQM